MQKQPQTLHPALVDFPVKFKNALAKYPTEKEFLINMNHLALEKRYEKLMTVAAAYNTDFLKLEELEFIYKKETPVSLLESWIIQTANFMKLELNKEQIHELALLLYEDCRRLNMAEMTLFFKRVKKGHYGAFYGTFDTWSILQWAREYRKERGMYVATLP